MLSIVLGTEIDWGYESQPQPNLNNRLIKLSQAKVLDLFILLG